jgi:Xaa-Pro aminopeptidase
MQEHGLDAILITGPAQHNPAMYYLTGGVHLTNADLIKRRGSEPVLFHYSMERDEAARTGMATRNLADYRPGELLQQTNGNALQAEILRYQKMLTDLGLTEGRLGLYGRIDAGQAYSVYSGLQEAFPGLTILGQVGDSILLQAMATKSADEIGRLRQIGRTTVEVVGLVADYLTGHRVEDETLVKKDGSPLTIGDVKSKINLWLAERGADNPEGTIFAIGRDAGVPHSSGNPADSLRLGQPIIFDIFPCEAGGGYYYDFTRTWCLGYASQEVQEIYEHVLAVYKRVMTDLKADTPGRDYQKLACDMFEQLGHATIQSNPQTESGYVHSLGHGLGLHIHEYPRLSMAAGVEDRLLPGSVVTIEPGLYYPERGLGVRLEDTVWVRPDGQFEILVEYPFDLVLPMRRTHS